MFYRRLLAAQAQVITLAMLAACAGGGGGQRNPAIAALDAGQCPATIVYSSGKAPGEDNRYGPGASYTDISHYRNRELANCQRLLEQGDLNAMTTLRDYWQDQKDPQREAETYKIYLETGTDPEVKVEAVRTLYDMYSKGRPGLRPDAEQAFYYTGQAIAYGDTSLRLEYADGLYQRKRYDEALGQYFEFQIPGVDARVAQGFTRQDSCETYLRLSGMYFEGRGTPKDKYLGYYFWQRGIEIAEGAEWGSCYRDNFVYGDRYYDEKQRKSMVEQNMATLTPSQVAELDRALSLSHEQGLAIAGSMAGGVGSRGTTRISRAPRVRYNTVTSAGWRGWSPLEADICGLQSPANDLPWADIFELRSTSIWSLKSTSQGSIIRGSAVAVAPDRLVTNCHLISNPDLVEIYQGSIRLRAQVTASDMEGDRCILAVGEAMPSYVRSGRPFGYLRVGEEVAAIGNPRGLDTSLSRGIIAQKRMNTGLALIQTDAALSTGSSGGGLFDSGGNLVGVTTFKIDDGENLNFAIAIDEFCR